MLFYQAERLPSPWGKVSAQQTDEASPSPDGFLHFFQNDRGEDCADRFSPSPSAGRGRGGGLRLNVKIICSLCVPCAFCRKGNTSTG